MVLFKIISESNAGKGFFSIEAHEASERSSLGILGWRSEEGGFQRDEKICTKALRHEYGNLFKKLSIIWRYFLHLFSAISPSQNAGAWYFTLFHYFKAMTVKLL